jgi:hypothetical protein
MQNKIKFFVAAIALFGTVSAEAISIDWSGGYRIEFHDINSTSLDMNNPSPKSYGLQHLFLDSKIVASDGINIVARFNVMANQTAGYENSQLGALIGGSGLGNDPRVSSQNQESTNVTVSHLYMNANTEFGSLVAGRAPFEFGMGITHNAGTGPFDHWYDNRDMVGYKFYVDNISFMPILAKVSQKDYGRGVTASDEIFVFEYKNKDNGAEAGVVQQTRKSSLESNDALSAPSPIVIPGAALSSAWSTKTVNLYLGREWESFKFKLEASFLTGSTGLTVAGEELNVNSYAVAVDLLFPKKEGDKWEFASKLGIASGDNPNTTGVYEGYQFDQNYDVAMLMFNHRLGQADFLTTKLIHTNAALTTGNSADDEAIGNAIYLAPTAKYQWNDKFDIKTSLIYAQLVTNPTLSLDTTKDLGTELDIELIYKPRERVIWSNSIGILLPGGAWKDGASNFENKTTYGFSTKAAITF